MKEMDTRKVIRQLRSVPTREGAGVHLKRAFGNDEAPVFDPFLLLDDFHSNVREYYIKGFPWHPHRGIETITYVLHGNVEHGDSLGNSGSIKEGDVQWMTAGSGIIHQEMPEGDEGGLLWGFQLWANLPSAQKMMEPRYRDVKSADIPEVELEGGVRVKIIAGEVSGVKGPVGDIVIDPEYLDVTVPAGAVFVHDIPRDHNAFAYTIEGEGLFDSGGGKPVGKETVLHYGEGDSVRVEAGEAGLRFLLVSGRPLKEPVAWGGPIVMNTEEELELAFEELQKGTFLKQGKHPG
jgi:redox-sensitive bicupin YhaK (pirin superfamily)